MPGVEWNGDVMGWLAEEKFAGPTWDRGRNQTHPVDSTVDFPPFFPGFEEGKADGFSLFLIAVGLHIAERP
jgi:hypothetical protein